MFPLICFLWWKKTKVKFKSFETGETRSMCWNYQGTLILLLLSTYIFHLVCKINQFHNMRNAQ